MEKSLEQTINADSNGLLAYDYVINNLDLLDQEQLNELTHSLVEKDKSGQASVSLAKYLKSTGIDYEEVIDLLIKNAIEKDREHKYIVELLSACWGDDYKEHVAELNSSDNNFRRIYKRVYGCGL